MKLLIIGGTLFLGRYLVESALAHGHEVTLFNRGKTNADLFPTLEKLHGDRTIDLSPLQGRTWDAVIDTCGYVPRHVRASAELLANAVEHYTFISSISVYKDVSQPGVQESDPVQPLEHDTEEVTGETYGPLKALCEQAAEAAMTGHVASLRAGVIVGPHDYTGRFPYWVKRVAEGGEVLAPGIPWEPVQIIDVRDLADWAIHLAETRQAGIYNATGPDYRLTMGHILETGKAVSASDASFTWVSADFLEKEGVSPWQDMPLFVPVDQGMNGMLAINISKALAAGLTFRPLADTIRDTLAWIKSSPQPEIRMPAGITREREAALLEKWYQVGKSASTKP